MITEIDKDSLEALSLALRLNRDNRRLPFSVYRVMVAIATAGEPCCAYAVARRAGFLLEHGRVKLHEAKKWGVVENVRQDEQGVLWRLTDKGYKELQRAMAILQNGAAPESVSEAQEASRPVKVTRKRKRQG